MVALTQPNEIAETAHFSGIIYGIAGIGKSTLSLSAPNPVMIDVEHGLKRVSRRFQSVSLQPTSYQDICDAMHDGLFDSYETIIIDTLGSFIDMMVAWLGSKNPKNIRSNGQPSQVGWGAVKAEFRSFVKRINGLNKNVLFIAHTKETKSGEDVAYRIDVAGSSGNELVKDVDFMGFMYADDGGRVISFTPNAKFFAKNSINLDPIIRVPDVDKLEKNTFVQDVIVNKTRERIKNDSNVEVEYNNLLSAFKENVSNIDSTDLANDSLKVIEETKHVWNSKIVMKKILNDKTKELGYTYKDGSFVANNS